jgi:hypothetical protein
MHTHILGVLCIQTSDNTFKLGISVYYYYPLLKCGMLSYMLSYEGVELCLSGITPNNGVEP